MNFSQALDALKAGKNLTRTGWNPSSMWIGLKKPHDKSEMTNQYIFLWTPEQQFRDDNWLGSKIPWTPTQRDLFAEDWEIMTI